MYHRVFGAATLAWLALIVAVIAATYAGAVASNYERSVANVLVSEGGYSNDAADPGGPTKFGITIHDVRLYIKKNAGAADVRALTEAQARTIYHDKYWLHPCVRGDQLPAGVDYSIFDYGVNAGVNRSGKKLRLAMGFNQNDCAISDGLIKLVTQKDAFTLIKAINAERRRFVHSLHTCSVFCRGWDARITSVERISLRMAGGPPSINLFGDLEEPEPAYGPGKAW